jgi:hypothetical protein
LISKTGCNREIYKSVNDFDCSVTTDSRGLRAYSMSKNESRSNGYEYKTQFPNSASNKSSNRTGSNIKRIKPGESAFSNNPNKVRKRSDSKGYPSRNTFSSTLIEPKPSNIKQVSEYLVKLSLLVFEAQNYTSSTVAVACVLAARHINHKNPLWSDDLTTSTGYSLPKIMKIANILLSNYNMLTIGDQSVRTSQTIGVQPHPFDGILIKDIESNESKNLPKIVNLPFEESRKINAESVSSKSSLDLLKESYRERNAVVNSVNNSLNKVYTTNTSN